MHVGNWSWISDSISSWTWPGYEHKPVKVEVFTRAEEAELYINGKLAGREKTGTVMPYTAVFDTIYEPGEIRAVCGGEEYVLRRMKVRSPFILTKRNLLTGQGKSQISRSVSAIKTVS